MRIVLRTAAFLELCGDDVLDPDVAVKQLESIAAELQGLDSEARDELIELALREAEAAYDPAQRDFLLSFADAFGLREP
jgi:hypothetical protein